MKNFPIIGVTTSVEIGTESMAATDLDLGNPNFEANLVSRVQIE
jgi:hypothetical protein